MKTQFTILGIVAVVFQSVAQTNNTRVEYKTITTTNWVKPGPYLRVVDGVTYNVAYSKKWNTFSKQEALMTPLPDMNDVIGGYPGKKYRVPKVTKTIGNASFFEIDEMKSSIDAPTQQISENLNFLKNVVVLNLSEANDKGVNFYCMRVADYVDSENNSFICYDCGVQATNLVPVIKTEKVRVSSTNEPTNNP